jgi:hypothetical protein
MMANELHLNLISERESNEEKDFFFAEEEVEYK